MFDVKIDRASKYIESLDAKELGTKIAILIGVGWLVTNVIASPFSLSWAASGVPGAMLIFRVLMASFAITIIVSGWAGWIWFNRPKETPSEPAPTAPKVEDAGDEVE